MCVGGELVIVPTVIMIHVDVYDFRVHVHVDIHCCVLILVVLRQAMAEMLARSESFILSSRSTQEIILMLSIVSLSFWSRLLFE